MTIPVNYDEAAVGPIQLPALMQGPDGRPVSTAAVRAGCQTWLRNLFAETMYGPIPSSPEGIKITCRALPPELPGIVTEEIVLAISCGGRRLERRLTVWRPDVADPVPVVAGLAFLGAAGATLSPAVAIPSDALIDGFERDGVREGRLTAAIRGRHADRSPIPLITGAGFALVLSGYGEWVPDHRDHWQEAGLWPFLRPHAGPRRPGAISLWAWAMLRMVDVVAELPWADPRRMALFGHSRLGKAALWAAANDERVSRVFVNNAGCAGTKLSRRNFGETLAHLIDRFPHWLAPACPAAAERLPVDQHQLIACVAPRGIHVASASEDGWADPRGEYLALKAALPFWAIGVPPPKDLPDPEDALVPGRLIQAGPVAWHLRPGPHDLTPWDWERFLACTSPPP